MDTHERRPNDARGQRAPFADGHRTTAPARFDLSLRGLPVIVRILLLGTVTGLGLLFGFGLGLALIRVLHALIGDVPTHSLRGLVVIASAYAVTGLTGVAALVVAWRWLFRKPD